MTVRRVTNYLENLQLIKTLKSIPNSVETLLPDKQVINAECTGFDPRGRTFFK